MINFIQENPPLKAFWNSLKFLKFLEISRIVLNKIVNFLREHIKRMKIELVLDSDKLNIFD
jgi:hypothetical protein